METIIDTPLVDTPLVDDLIAHRRFNAGKIAGLAGRRPDDDPELSQARRDNERGRFAAHTVKLLSTAPPFTEAMRSELVALFTAGLEARSFSERRSVPGRARRLGED